MGSVFYTRFRKISFAESRRKIKTFSGTNNLPATRSLFSQEYGGPIFLHAIQKRDCLLSEPRREIKTSPGDKQSTRPPLSFESVKWGVRLFTHDWENADFLSSESRLETKTPPANKKSAGRPFSFESVKRGSVLATLDSDRGFFPASESRRWI